MIYYYKFFLIMMGCFPIKTLIIFFDNSYVMCSMIKLIRIKVKKIQKDFSD